MKEGISIIICTYNGARVLPITLRHVAHQQVPSDLAWEVLLIDNASTDNSSLVAEREWTALASTAPLRILHQPKPGLNFARELGFTNARYKYIIMCDDDNWLANDYIITSYTIMELHPAIGMLGGKGEYIYETPPPSWVTAHPIHAGGPQAPATGRVPHHGLYGAGSVMRKSAYQAICQAGFKFRLTDRLGNQLSSGGDFELCHGLAMVDYLIWYDDRLQFKHYITSGRITWEYYVNYLNEDASSYAVLEPYKILLDTTSSNLVIFGITLIKNFAHYTVSLLYNLFISKWSVLTETDKKIRALKVITLKARIISYKQCFVMARNFLAATRFRKRYNEQLKMDAVYSRPVTARSELV